MDDLLDERTVATLGSAPSCAWKDEATVTVVFGSGEGLLSLHTDVPGDYAVFCCDGRSSVQRMSAILVDDPDVQRFPCRTSTCLVVARKNKCHSSNC